MTSWTVTQTHRYRAAIEGADITDWSRSRPNEVELHFSGYGAYQDLGRGQPESIRLVIHGARWLEQDAQLKIIG